MSADPTLSGLVGGCIYPVLVPTDATFPCVSYAVVSSSSEYALDGSQENWKRIQIDAWSETYATAKAIQVALHSLFDGFTGVLPDGTTVLGCFRGVEVDQFEQNARAYRALTEYAFHYVEPDTAG